MCGTIKFEIFEQSEAVVNVAFVLLDELLFFTIATFLGVRAEFHFFLDSQADQFQGVQVAQSVYRWRFVCPFTYFHLTISRVSVLSPSFRLVFALPVSVFYLDSYGVVMVALDMHADGRLLEN